jgi:DNA-binding MarR family transcriptional regulator
MASKRTPPPARGHRPTGTEADALLRLDHQLCFALYSASLAMTRTYKPLLEPLGLTYPQYLVMLSLWEADGLSVGAVGERLGLDSGTLTPLLKRLEAAGLVQRLRDAADERRVLLQLTPAGRQLKARAASVPLSLAEATGCSLDEVARLTQRLKRLRDDLLPKPTLSHDAA